MTKNELILRHALINLMLAVNEMWWLIPEKGGDKGKRRAKESIDAAKEIIQELE